MKADELNLALIRGYKLQLKEIKQLIDEYYTLKFKELDNFEKKIKKS